MRRVDISGLGGLLVLVSALSLGLHHSMYLIIGYAVLLLIILLTWRLYLPNVFTFIMLFHWVQVISYLFFVNTSWNGDIGLFTSSSVPAFIYSLVGLLVMSFIFSQFAYKNLEVSLELIDKALERI